MRYVPEEQQAPQAAVQVAPPEGLEDPWFGADPRRPVVLEAAANNEVAQGTQENPNDGDDGDGSDETNPTTPVSFPGEIDFDRLDDIAEEQEEEEATEGE